MNKEKEGHSYLNKSALSRALKVDKHFTDRMSADFIETWHKHKL